MGKNRLTDWLGYEIRLITFNCLFGGNQTSSKCIYYIYVVILRESESTYKSALFGVVM